MVCIFIFQTRILFKHVLCASSWAWFVFSLSLSFSSKVSNFVSSVLICKIMNIAHSETDSNLASQELADRVAECVPANTRKTTEWAVTTYRPPITWAFLWAWCRCTWPILPGRHHLSLAGHVYHRRCTRVSSITACSIECRAETTADLVRIVVECCYPRYWLCVFRTETTAELVWIAVECC